VTDSTEPVKVQAGTFPPAKHLRFNRDLQALMQKCLTKSTGQIYDMLYKVVRSGSYGLEEPGEGSGRVENM
jgi:hypothetical protein